MSLTFTVLTVRFWNVILFDAKKLPVRPEGIQLTRKNLKFSACLQVPYRKESGPEGFLDIISVISKIHNVNVNKWSTKG